MDQQPEKQTEKPLPKPPLPPKAEAPKNSQNWTKKAVAVLVIAVIGSFIAGYTGFLVARETSDTVETALTSQHDGNTITSEAEQSVAGVAEKVAPSVVSILTETDSRMYYGMTSEGAGTGVIVSSDGYVMTNKHVVEDTSTVSIVTSDGTTYDRVQVVGTDPLNDIAFLKISGVSNLKAAQLGNSSTVRIGQEVVAIGNSLGQYQNTVTSGIISGTNRPVSAQSGDSIETLTDLLQTDAAINPGNSGGPLVNMSGQVIGINTAIATNAQGIGFAIPINATKGMIKSLLGSGELERSYLGVSYIPVTPEVAARYDLNVDDGAYVYSEQNSRAVAAGGPADKAGIKVRDIITKVGGVEVGKQGGVASLVGEYAPGEMVEITLLRGGKEQVVKVTLEAYPD